MIKLIFAVNALSKIPSQTREIGKNLTKTDVNSSPCPAAKLRTPTEGPEFIPAGTFEKKYPRPAKAPANNITERAIAPFCAFLVPNPTPSGTPTTTRIIGIAI